MCWREGEDKDEFRFFVWVMVDVGGLRGWERGFESLSFLLGKYLFVLGE